MKRSKPKHALQEVTNLSQPIWEQQRYEPPKQFARFALYRDMGAERTQVAVAEEVGVNRDKIGAAAMRWRWKERAEAWDRHLDGIKAKEIEAASRTMASRQAKLGMLLQDKAIVGLQELAWSDDNPVTARDVVALADAGVKIERLARGEKTEDTGGVTIQLAMMPSWAKSSPFVKVVDAETVKPKQLTEGDGDGRPESATESR